VLCAAGAKITGTGASALIGSGASASLSGTALPPYYYRDNFLRLLDAVERQYPDLLKPDEQHFLDCYRQLGFDAQCLYVRLVSRVGPWFRESRLRYPELESVAAALEELLLVDLVVLAGELSTTDIGGLFTRDELAAVTGGRGSKAALLASQEQAQWNVLLPRLDSGRIFAPQHNDTVALLQLLFFGNRHQGMTDFVLSDLGVARYYPYSLDPARRLFPHRAAVAEYLRLATIGDAYRELEEADERGAQNELVTELLRAGPEYTTSRKRWDRLCNYIARHQERVGNNDLAMALYQQSRSHPARERIARLLEKRGDLSRALALTQEIAADPWCEEERDAAARIRPRVRRKVEGGKLPRRRDDFSRLELSVPRADQPVELLTAQQLASDWASVHYVENKLMNALFGLAFWEVIFAPVPGAFHNPYQSVPDDMYDLEFTERRRLLVENRLEELGRLNLTEELTAAWRRFRGFQCRWVSWRHVDLALVAAASRVIPAAHLLAIWEHILFDPRENRRGFPDLMALGDQPGDYCLIEVKGPGDALQDSQKRWLRRFGHIGVPARVAWVTWCDE
jgi:FAN1, HTH domain/VRR-NUC domain